MCSSPAKPRILLKKIGRRTGGVASRRRSRAVCEARRSHENGGRKSNSKVSDKLEALKNLIPSRDSNGEFREAEELFQQTADYIVLLETRVAVLQRLIDVYGSEVKEDKVLLSDENMASSSGTL